MKQEKNLDSFHHMMICDKDKSLTHPKIECDIVTRMTFLAKALT